MHSFIKQAIGLAVAMIFVIGPSAGQASQPDIKTSPAAAAQSLNATLNEVALTVLAYQGNIEAQVLLAQIYGKQAAKTKQYREAIMWLERAAKADPSQSSYVGIAQHNLAAYHTKGWGVPQNIQKAIALYKKAATNGFLEAQKVLISIYHEGAYVPKDEVATLQWVLISIANGHDHPKAQDALAFLAKKLTTEQRTKAVTAATALFPDLTLPDISIYPPAKAGDTAPNLSVKMTKGLPTLPIARSAGYTEAFEKLHKRPAEDSAKIILTLKKNLNRITPPYIFEIAQRTFATDKKEAAFYFHLARVRASFDANRCTDKTAGQGMIQWVLYLRHIATFLEENPNISQSAMRRALDYDQKHPGTWSAKWVCFHGIQAVLAATKGKTLENWIKSEAAWPGLRRDVRKRFAKSITG